MRKSSAELLSLIGGVICVGFLCPFATGTLADAQAKKAGDAVASADAKEIIAKEYLLQKYEIEFNYAGIEKLTLPDFTELSQSIENRDQIIAGLRRFSASGCRIQPVKMKNAKVTFLSPDIATLVYFASQTGTCFSRTFTADANIATLWVRHDGQWQAQMHTELLATP
jgi:hypothetical protein